MGLILASQRGVFAALAKRWRTDVETRLHTFVILTGMQMRYRSFSQSLLINCLKFYRSADGTRSAGRARHRDANGVDTDRVRAAGRSGMMVKMETRLSLG